MDASSTTMTVTHLLIIWTLLGVLLVWILLFAFLSLHPDVKKTVEVAEEPTTLFTPSTLATHVAQPTVSVPTHARMYEPVSEAAPFV